jgi:drug/metabolite transporter (DMT)-like permease
VSLLGGFRPEQLVDVPLRSWLAVGFSGGVSVVLSYILWNRALLRLGPTRTAVFVNLSPVWGLLMSWSLEGETLTWFHALGAALIVGGVLAANLRPRRSAKQRSPDGAVEQATVR